MGYFLYVDVEGAKTGRLIKNVGQEYYEVNLFHNFAQLTDRNDELFVEPEPQLIFLPILYLQHLPLI